MICLNDQIVNMIKLLRQKKNARKTIKCEMSEARQRETERQDKTKQGKGRERLRGRVRKFGRLLVEFAGWKIDERLTVSEREREREREAKRIDCLLKRENEEWNEVKNKKWREADA